MSAAAWGGLIGVILAIVLFGGLFFLLKKRAK